MFSRMRSWLGQPANRSTVIRALLVAVFLVLAGRFWHPVFGFTQFLQIGADRKAEMLPVLRTAPLYFYTEVGGYDGQYYAQLAASPALNDPDLPGAIDNPAYRARRILLSWVAWLTALGDPVGAARVYAWLNLAVWGALAALLWRIFPHGGWRSDLAWAGILFAAGSMQSVRLALTDLAGLLLVALALWQIEKGRNGAGTGWLALAALARETSLLGAVGLWPETKARAEDWWRAAGRCVLVVLPLAGWLVYIWFVAGWPEPGLQNLARPVVGWVERWCEVLVAIELQPNRPLAVTDLLTHLALSVQFVFLLIRPRWSDRWWRLGAAYTVLLLFLGTAVWEGLPGAVARVLLPLTLAFNVLAVRTRAGAGWLLLGNLSVAGGVLMMWSVPENPRELFTDWSPHRLMLVVKDPRWFDKETRGHTSMTWAAQDGRLTVSFWPWPDRPRVQLRLRGITDRDLEIRHAGRTVWRGRLTTKPEWYELPELSPAQGRLELELHCPEPPRKEGDGPYARELGFACYGVRLAE